MALGLLLGSLVHATPASAQAPAPAAPTARVIEQSAWVDPHAAARRLAVARVEAMVAAATREDRHGEALELLERAHADRLARDRDSLRRLARAASRLDPPGGEPGWLGAGIGLLAAGVIGAVATPLVWAGESPCFSLFGSSRGCVDSRDEAPLIGGLVLSGTVFLTGIVMMGVFLVRHVFAPERRSFLQRRGTLIEALIDASASAGLAW